MRQSCSPKSSIPFAKLLWVALMASAATGCSSDASRFSGLFSNTDNMSTASVGQRPSIMNNAPVPMADVNNAGGTYAPQSAATGGDYTSRQQAMAQPYPGQQTYSPARRASSAVSVQKSDLAPPPGSTASNGPVSTRRQTASAQPFPAATDPTPTTEPDRLRTGTVPHADNPKDIRRGSNGWSSENAPRVVLKPGETLAVLSKRYGVPEKEIVKANGLSSASAARPGQSIVIPTFGARSTPVRTAATEGALLPPGQNPVPVPRGEEKVAVLPTNPKLRDKARSEIASANASNRDGNGTTPPGADVYVVKPGDSLSKIAQSNGVSIAALKQANGLNAQGVRVGQKLNLPAQNTKAVVTQVSTGALPARTETPKAASAPTKSVTEVASTDPNASAPDSTGIGKYRWPVRGAVVAAFGANVGGKRNDGIDISVPNGTAIKAAENGVVIYAGNGLKELGNTVLLRHEDGTVTVYGYASSISVQRGQKVQRGQQIAQSGMTGNATQPTLHFEVRKDAVPVNPMTFLE